MATCEDFEALVEANRSLLANEEVRLVSQWRIANDGSEFDHDSYQQKVKADAEEGAKKLIEALDMIGGKLRSK